MSIKWMKSTFNNIFIEKMHFKCMHKMSLTAVTNDTDNFAPFLFQTYCDNVLIVLVPLYFSSRDGLLQKTITSDFIKWPPKKMVHRYY